MLTFYRVERYTASASASATEINGSVPQNGVPRSPILASRTNAATVVSAPAPDSKQQSHISLPVYGTRSQIDTNSSKGAVNQSQVFASPVAASPLVGVSPGIGLTGLDSSGAHEPHLSGHEPRYFPGVVQRRRGSTRQSSMHESDENVGKRFSGRKENLGE